MTVTASVGVDGHGVTCGMAADTKRGVQDMTKTSGSMIDMEMGAGRGFILVAIETVNRSLVGIGNNHGHGCARWHRWVDISGGIMTGGATTKVRG